MTKKLKVQLGQWAESGVKSVQQDFHGAGIPTGQDLARKGIVCALADGISSSNVSHIASETAVSGFIQDYYATPDSWRVKTSAERVINSINAWLYSQTQQSQGRFDKDRGYVCTFSCLILKHDQAHLFHIGDARIYRIQQGGMEQLTHDHRVSLSAEESYLSRALGVEPKVEIDYLKIPIYAGDYFVLMTDGAYEYLDHKTILTCLAENPDLDEVAHNLIQLALASGSQDNLSVQIVYIESVVTHAQEFDPHVCAQSFMPEMNVGETFDGFLIQKILHQSHRSRLYLATDQQNQHSVVIKTLSTELSQQQQSIDRFLLEEWVAKRVNHSCVMRAYDQQRPKTYLYQTFEYIEGQTLAEWLQQQSQPVALDRIIKIVEQIAHALMAFHRLEMLHQDIRPENVLIDGSDHIHLIDFGSVSIRSLKEMDTTLRSEALGTLAYMAPEYFLGEPGTERSDQYSLAVLSYYLITHQLPYGTDVAKCTSKKQLKQVQYQPLSLYREDVPNALEAVLKKSLQFDPHRRYEALSEWVHELKQPPLIFREKKKVSVLERDPELFWRNLALILLLMITLYVLWHYL